MSSCVICGCTDDDPCIIGDVGDNDPVALGVNVCLLLDAPMCSRCADNSAELLAGISKTGCTAAQRLGGLGGRLRVEAENALVHAILTGALVRDGELLRVPTSPVPPLELVGTFRCGPGRVQVTEVWSPGTYTVGKGWGPVRSDLAAAVKSAAADSGPQLALPFGRDPKGER
jgi:hypothetical protein